MTLQFNETAPGVHTATLADPKTNQRHNVAVIESCNAFQLFIDGELSARDLPSFKAAVAQAESNFKTSRSKGMVRIACFLVLASLAGATAIGAVRLLSDDLNASPALETKVAAKPPIRTFQRVKPAPKQPVKTVAVTPPAPKAIEHVSITVTDAKSGKKEAVVLPALAVTKPAGTPPDTGVETASASQDAPRRFSAARNMLAINAAKTTPKPAPKEPKPVVEAASPAVVAPSPAPPAAPVQTALVELPSSNPVTEVSEDDTPAINEMPPLPQVAPPSAPSPAIVTASLPVRFATAANERPVIDERDADLDANPLLRDAETSFESQAAPNKPKATKRSKSRRPASRSRRTARRSRDHRPRSRKASQSSRRETRTAEIRRTPRQARRMSCFAHVCRFR